MSAIAVLSSIASLAVCAGIAYAAGYPDVGNQLAGREDIGPVSAYAAVVIMAIQWICFVPAFITQTEKYYDLVGSITYVSVTIATLIYRLTYSNPGGLVNVRPIVCSMLVLVWAFRLGSFLVKRINRAGKDGRFDEVKPYFAPFLAAWTIQGLWVTLTLLSVLIINTTSLDKGVAWPDVLGWAIWVIGFTIEVVADNQKSAFNALKTGKWVDVGIWRYSRHPNYFGEITLWTGQFVAGASIYRGGQWVAVLSPLFVAFLLSFITGIPMLESRADEKWGSDPEYQRYKQQVSILVLWPRKKVPTIGSPRSDSEAALREDGHTDPLNS